MVRYLTGRRNKSMNDILYSPWRLQYIISEKENQCIFCVKPNSKDDAKHLILYRTELSFVIMNLYPYNNGHLMVVPYRHVARLSDLEMDEVNDLFQLVQTTEGILTRVYHSDGFNIGLNLGKAAGAGIDEHLHVHIVPRWNGDCNFMHSINGTRVIPEAFEQAYAKIKEEFDKLPHEK